jgi:hypothetical protein
MTVPLAETTRALRRETRAPAVLAVAGFCALLASWLGWIFFGEVPVRVEVRGVVDGDRVQVLLPDPELRGYAARLRSVGSSEAFAAEVRHSEAGAVELHVREAGLRHGDSVVVEVEVERTSPWGVVERALRGGEPDR